MPRIYQSVLLTVGLDEQNFVMMKNALSNEFIIVESADAENALRILQEGPHCGMLLLNLIAPCQAGWDVLSQLEEAQLTAQYPALVLTDVQDEKGRIKALEMGAADVLTSLMEPHLAIKRIHNLLRTVQLDALAKSCIAKVRQLESNNEKAQIAEIDELTGLSTHSAFCRKVSSIIKDRPAGSYVIVRWDIDRFKIYKDIYGISGADELVRYIGQRYLEHPEWYACHIGADHFIHCIPIALFDPQKTEKTILGWLNESKNKYSFMPRIGVYVVDDPELDVNIISDRAQLALLTLKGNYQRNLAYYDHSMRERLREEQELIGDMEGALAEGQFHVYLQPQYNHANGSIVGAEALVRWFHPTKGLIPPASFIPVFERNGFINRLDYYMWEQVCKLLRQWIDEGRQVVPVSVNISRVDIADQGLLDMIDHLVEKYHISTDLLRLEITESAYMDNPDQLITMVNRLRERGFLVEMDDFGSGYSSLNMLKNVPVDVLKLDMKFLSRIDERGGNILNSIVRMAHWLDLPIIAEGVETFAQADYLHSMGCMVMQGYYYARPMPVEQFEELMSTTTTASPERSLPNTAVEGSLDFINPTTQAALLFSSFVGGAAIMEYDGNELETLRINERYLEEMGTTMEDYTVVRRGLLQWIDVDFREILIDAMQQAEQTGKQQQCEFRMKAIPPKEGWMWHHVHIRFLARNMNHLIYYFDVTNNTTRRELMEKNIRLNDELNAIINNVPGGIIHFELIEDKAHIVYCNDAVPALFGYDQEDFFRRFSQDPTKALHQEDRALLIPMLQQAAQDAEGGEHSIRYRTRLKSGGWRWTQMYAQRLRTEDDKQFITAIVLNMDELAEKDDRLHEQEASLRANTLYLKSLYDALPCGVMRYDVKQGGDGELVRFNEALWRMFGYESELQYRNATFGDTMKNTHPEDLKLVQENLRRMIDGENNLSFEHRIVRQDGTIGWVEVLMKHFSLGDGEGTSLCIFTDITDRVHKQSQVYRDALMTYMDELFEVDLEQDTILIKNGQTEDDEVRIFSKYINQWCMHAVAEEDRSRVQRFFAELALHDIPIQTIRHRVYRDAAWLQDAETIMLHTGEKHFFFGVKYLSNETADFQRLREMSRNPYGNLQPGEEETLLTVAMLDYDPEADCLSMRMERVDGTVLTDTYQPYLSQCCEPKPHPVLAAGARCCFRKALVEAGNYCENYGCEVDGGRMGWYRLRLLSAADEHGRVTRISGMLLDNQQRVERDAISAGLSRDFSNISSNYQYSLAEMLMRITAAGCDSTQKTIETIIRNTGEQLGLARVYVVKDCGDGTWFTGFEWCAGGVPPQKENQQNRRFPEEIDGAYHNYFDSNGILIGVKSLAEHPELARMPFDMHNTLQIAIEYAGDYHGFLGFEFVDAKEITPSRIGIALMISMSLSILIGQRHRLSERMNRELELKDSALRLKERYRCMMEQAGVYVIEWNYDTNQFSIEYSDHQTNQIVQESGIEILEHVHPDDRDALVSYFQDEEWKQQRRLNLRLRTEEDAYRWMRIGTANLERLASGELRAFAALVDMDEATNASEALVESHQRFEDIVEHVPSGVSIHELDGSNGGYGKLIYANPNFASFFGLDYDTFLTLHETNEHVEYLHEMSPSPAGIEERFWSGEVVHIRKAACRLDGKLIWIAFACKLLQRRGKYYCYAASYEITEQVESEQKERWEQERYRIISEIDDIVVFDYRPDDDMMTLSKARPGQQAEEELHPNYLKSLESRSFYIHNDDLAAVRHCLINACRKPVSGVLEFMGRYFCEDYRWQRMRYVSMADEAGNVYRLVGCIEDINEERVLHNQLEVRAQYDGTTGLMNKDTGRIAIEEALADMQEDQTDALLFVDLDNFKNINDTYGHPEGDVVLHMVAQRISSLFRQNDIVARFGGDEFVVYMRNTHSIEVAKRKAELLIKSVSEIRLKGEGEVRCSVGVTAAHPNEEFSAVFERMDAALYLAKTAGKNQYKVLLQEAEQAGSED